MYLIYLQEILIILYRNVYYPWSIDKIIHLVHRRNQIELPYIIHKNMLQVMLTFFLIDILSVEHNLPPFSLTYQ